MATRYEGEAAGAAITAAHVLRAMLAELMKGTGRGTPDDVLHRVQMSVLRGMMHPQDLMDAEARAAYDEMFAIIFSTQR